MALAGRGSASFASSPAIGGAGGYGPIGGPLPFSGGGSDYASAYNAALSFNKANYDQILAGYQNTAAAQQAQQQKVLSGYNALQGSVLGGLQGIDASQRQDIADAYAKNVGIESQRLISRGLGNSTVQQSIARGLMYDKAKADIALTNSTQGLNAQYQTQLGLAGLGYQGQALQQNTALAKAQLDFMNSINAGYPDARSYAALAQMKGASAGGGFVGPGSVTNGGPVKSPLGSGGYQSPAAQFGYQSNYSNTGRPQGYGYGGFGGEQTIFPYSGMGPGPYPEYENDYPEAYSTLDDYWTTPSETQAGGVFALPGYEGDGWDGEEWDY